MRFRALSSRGRVRVLSVAAVALFVLGVSSQSAFAAAPAWAPVAATGPTVLPPVQSTVQKLTVEAEGGTYTLTFSGQTTTPISYDANAGEVEAALNALSTVGGAGGSVHVTGGPGGPRPATPYTLAFGGTLANTAVERITTNASGLTGGAAAATIAVAVSGGQGTTSLAVYAYNVGGYESLGELTMKVQLPAGVTTTETPKGAAPNGSESWTCSTGGGQTEFTCTSKKSGGMPAVRPTEFATPVHATITAAAGAMSGAIHYEISGGGASPASGELPLTISPQPAGPGVQSFVAGAYDANGDLDTQAGDHPYSADAAIMVNTKRSPTGTIVPVGEFKNILVDLPSGFLGNATAVPQCPESTETLKCPFSTMVGVAIPLLTFGASIYGGVEAGESAVFNSEAPLGYPGKFRFNVLSLVPFSVVAQLRSEEDYGITAASLNTPQIEKIYGSFFSFWGAPAEESHNSLRCNKSLAGNQCGPAAEGPPTAFLTNAADCAEQALTPPVTRLRATLWQEPDEVFTSSVDIAPVTGCGNLKFEGNLSFQPNETTHADSPTAFATEITTPSEGLTSPSKLANPPIKRVAVTLPEGVVLNPSAVNGLSSCSEKQIGFDGSGYPMPNPMRFDAEPNTCPESSKIGTVELKTALIEETLHGALYLAAQDSGNPFGSLFALYLVIEDPRNGIFIKLPGEVEPDTKNGNLKVTFEDLPQLPFTSVSLHLKGGNGAALASPDTCGTFTTNTEMVPWSAPESGSPLQTTSSFNITSGANGSACASTPAQRPFNPALSAGTTSTTAGAFTPFVVKLSRNDGEQELSSIAVNAPPGFVGILTGLPFCPESAIKAAEANTGTAEQQNPSCPASTQIGTLTAAVGAGSTPFYASGKAYFAGPYEGDPFSVVFVTPAVAGPFDLGDVVVRAGIHINPETAQISVKTNAIPQILDGVPLQVRSIEANINRPNFGLNPTSCEKSTITTTIQGGSGAVASPSSAFQVGGCSSLAFKPQFSSSTLGRTSKADGASLSVKLAFPITTGEANIAKVKVELPKQLPSRLTTLQKACVASVFDANPASCPKESIVGMAKAITPVLPVPLVGPAYFVSHGGEAFPSLVIVLQGYGVTIDLTGTTFISKAGITSSTFKTVPDVAVNTFELTLPEGPYSALTANGTLCTQKLVMPTEFIAQNGTHINQSTPITVEGCSTSLSFKHTVKKKTLTLSIYAPTAGKITASGKGLTTKTKTTKGQEDLTITLKQKRAGKLKTTVKVIFTPSAGKDRKKQTKSAKLQFKK